MYFNAHCHLELSFAAGKIKPELDFCDWILEVIRLRQTTSESEIIEAAKNSLKSMHDLGISNLWDIDSMNLMNDVYNTTSTDVKIFQELIALEPAAAEERIQSKITQRTKNYSYGLSPHAPYSVSSLLFQKAFDISKSKNEWLCIHCAETKEENEFLQKGTGLFREMLESIGALPQNWKAPNMSAVEYLDSLKVLGEKTLLVHCNILSEAEFKIIRDTKTKVAVCPGTHVYFGREEFPLKKLLDNNIDVYLGTDSLASNEQLDMEREGSLAHDLCPEVSRNIIRDILHKKPPR